MISAKILCDSINNKGDRLTTFLLTYPRFIHSELMTHRVFSRNSASSRAIPTSKFIKMVEENPAIPLHWGKLQKGMQAFEQINDIDSAEKIWLEARDKAVIQAKKLLELKIHKQVINRILEPYMHMTVVLSGTEYINWYKLRDHKDAQPEIQSLAHTMKVLHEKHTPNYLNIGEWHLPFFTNDLKDLTIEEKIKVCVARCARTSYNNFYGKNDRQSDYDLFDKLCKSEPKHLSPLEHIAYSAPGCNNYILNNFKGFTQYRKLIE